MRTLKTSKDGPLQERHTFLQIEFSSLKEYIMAPWFYEYLGKEKVKSAVRETSWGFLVARADARS